jgi:hypothetical protein
LKNKLRTARVLAYASFDLPFILTTGDSKFEIAPILSQEQDGIERPITYASKEMIKA